MKHQKNKIIINENGEFPLSARTKPRSSVIGHLSSVSGLLSWVIGLRSIFLIVLGLWTISGTSQTLSLDTCKAYAIENNKRLKETRLELQASQEVKKDAWTKYFPSVSAGAVAMKANKGLLEMETPEMNLPVYDGNPANLPNATQFAYVPGMNVELLDYANIGYAMAIQPIYAGSRIRNGNKLASLGEEFSQHKVDLTTDEVVVKTEDYYWTLVSLEQKKKALVSYENLMNNLLSDVTISYEAGLTQKSDMLKVKLEINKINTNKLQLENGISLLKMTLAQHIGIVYSDAMSVASDSIEVKNPQMLYRNPNGALQNRTEYQMLNKAIKAEELQKKMTRGEYMPQIAVGVQGLYMDMMDNSTTNALAFATLSIPISDWWGGSHKFKEHKLKINIAQNNLDEKSELLKLQMDKTFKDLIESYKLIDVAEISQEQAREHLKVIQDNYDAGIVSTSDLLEAQAILQQTQDNVVDAKATYKIKQAYYLQSVSALQY